MKSLRFRVLGLTGFLAAVTAFQAFRLFISPSYPYSIPVFEHLFARLELPGSLVLIAVLLLTLPMQSEGEKVLKWVEGLHRYRAFIFVGAGLAFVAGVHWFYFRHPLCMDEYAPWFQAQLFASGRLTSNWPHEDDVFRFMNPGFLGAFFQAASQSGELASKYWPGFALLLAPFAMLGIPWLLNPLLAVGSLVLLDRICLRFVPDGRASGWAMLLALGSPAFIAYAISYYSWNAHLFANLLFLCLLLEATPRRAFAAGVVGSWALALHQPLAHALFALPWMLYFLFKERRVLGYLCLGYLPLVLLLGLGWKIVLLELFSKPGGGFGGEDFGRYGSIFGWPQGHWSLFSFLKLFTWAVPGLPLVALLAVERSEKAPYVKMMLGSALLTLFGYVFLVFSQGHGWGNRYFHSAFGVLPILGALALTSSEERLRTLRIAMANLAVLSLIFLNLTYLFGIRSFIGAHLAQLPEVEPSSSQRLALINIRPPYYRQDLIQNSPFLDTDVLWAMSYGDERDARWVQQRFPGAVKLESFRMGGSLWRLPGSGQATRPTSSENHPVTR